MNLELASMVEAISVDGKALKPGFIFSGASYFPEWFEEDAEITYKNSLLRNCDF
jgi:hypothetical protein